MIKASDKYMLRNSLQNTCPVLLNTGKWVLKVIRTESEKSSQPKEGLGDMKVNVM